jgi:signal transduction histidine kinase
MISAVLNILTRGVRYLKSHPQLAFVLVLIFVLPYLFLYSGQHFLDAGRANQERLQKDRVGLMHDTFASVMRASDFNPDIMQAELEAITAQNPDITNFAVLTLTDGEPRFVAAVDTALIGTTTAYSDFLRHSAASSYDSLIYPLQTSEGRVWTTYRSIERTPGQFYFIYTEHSLQAIDAVFKANERVAYVTLIYVYMFLMGLAYWHIRLTDYRYLYQEATRTIASKDQFMNMMVHELRAPLTAMRGYASLIYESSAVPEDARRHATSIGDATERLTAMVNDLLEVARLQSGKLSISNSSVVVPAVITAVVAELTVSAKEKGIALCTEFPTTPITITSDEKRLYQALTNLVSNAIKYTPRGSITLTLTERYRAVEIRIKDTGTGISHEDQQKLFAPFFRVASDHVEKITGSGLGMWITKQLIELMGGTIAVESIKGVGTHLVIELPKEVSPKR